MASLSPLPQPGRQSRRRDDDQLRRASGETDAEKLVEASAALGEFDEDDYFALEALVAPEPRNLHRCRIPTAGNALPVLDPRWELERDGKRPLPQFSLTVEH